ncbi:MAG: hypothetical protein BWK80_33620 [Desulfobacteraceae bacterium IS3]|nr:MAG: hypothetical protein BWK80_33620 [Desulfobacteraceae bacterium IS3]
MQKIVFVLCEGPHDVAFLYRILKTIGFKNYTEKIKDFPPPINDFIVSSVKQIDINEMKLDDIRNRPIPSEAVFKDESLFLLYSVHGDSKKPVRKGIIEKISQWIPYDSDGISPLESINLSVLYFFDADQKGILRRLDEVKQELAEFGCPISPDYFRQNGSIHIINKITYGAYIFAKDDDKGKLEDILVPMMKADNQEIFDKATEYLQLKDDSRLKKLEIKKENGEITEVRTGDKMKFDLPKSEICVAGQLQNSGKSNVVIIKDCDYLNLEKIRNSRKCQEITEFFKKIL